MKDKGTHSKCNRVKGCPFFEEQMAKMPRSIEIMKEMFCYSEYVKCARYIVYSECGSEYVPVKMFPSEFRNAQEIVKKCKG